MKHTCLWIGALLVPMLLMAAAAGAWATDLNDDLFTAVRKGDAAAVAVLLAKGADVNAKGPYDQTPLFFAADRGHLAIVKLLVEKGADVNRKDAFYSFTAIGRAAQKNHIDVIKYLASNGATGLGQLANQAVYEDDKELLKAVLDTGKLSAKELTAALLVANNNKKTEIAELLKAAGAQPPAASITLDAATLASYAGTYQGGRGGTEFEVSVTVVEGNLKGGFRGQVLTLAPFSQTEFRGVEQASVTVEFKTEGGKVSGFVLEPGAQVFTRKQ